MLQIAISKLEQHKEFTIVFIGGKNDGEIRTVNRVPPSVNMPEHYKRIDLTFDFAYNPCNTVAITYVHEALTEAEVLNILLTRYVQDTSADNK
ncbi:hypothetical protein NVP1138O_34 [Vibrio phage 1.138.O._10N.261.48.A1]|nr:hypothetical protein NVP1138O_34 [Vibrio phage 1.138.O._10N.261.48.A1]